VEVMGLYWRGGDVQLLDVSGPDVDHLVDVLESPFDEQKLGIGDKIPVSLIKIGVDDGIGYAGLVLDGKKDETVRRAGSLPGDDAAGDACLHAMADQLEIPGPKDIHLPELGTAMRHGMTTYRDAGPGVVGNHALFRVHGLKRRDLFLVAVEPGEEWPGLPAGTLHLPERITAVNRVA